MVSTTAQQTPIVTPNASVQFTTKDGQLTQNGRIALQQNRDFVVNTARLIPTEPATVNNSITLSLLPVQPIVTQYAAFDTYAFVADATTTGHVTAQVQTANGTMETLNVYKNNGATQAGNNDIMQGSQYHLTYTDSLNSGAGGFVLR